MGGNKIPELHFELSYQDCFKSTRFDIRSFPRLSLRTSSRVGQLTGNPGNDSNFKCCSEQLLDACYRRANLNGMVNNGGVFD
jgi:hypothetical protein